MKSYKYFEGNPFTQLQFKQAIVSLVKSLHSYGVLFFEFEVAVEHFEGIKEEFIRYEAITNACSTISKFDLVEFIYCTYKHEKIKGIFVVRSLLGNHSVFIQHLESMYIQKFGYSYIEMYKVEHLPSLDQIIDSFLKIALDFEIGFQNHSYSVLGNSPAPDKYTYGFFLAVSMYLPYNRDIPVNKDNVRGRNVRGIGPLHTGEDIVVHLWNIYLQFNHYTIRNQLILDSEGREVGTVESVLSNKKEIFLCLSKELPEQFFIPVANYYFDNYYEIALNRMIKGIA